MPGHLEVQVDEMTFGKGASASIVIDKLKLSFPPGSFTSILGPSGSGKTTLLRIIAGLECRFRGRITLDGQSVTRPSREIQLVFQDYRLLPWMTVKGNLLFATNGASVAERHAIADRWLAAVRLTGKETMWPKTLSGGEEARLAFARALVGDPRVVLLDEPFRNLDLAVKLELQAELEQHLAKSGRTAVMVSHSPEDAVLLSDRVLVFDRKPIGLPLVMTVALARPRRPGGTEHLTLANRLTELLTNRPQVAE